MWSNIKKYKVTLWNDGCDRPVASYLGCTGVTTTYDGNLAFKRENGKETQTNLRYEVEEHA